MATITYIGGLITTSCWCGIHLAVPSDLHHQAKTHKGQHIYCPLGHQFIYDNTTEEELAATRQRLTRERQAAQATRDLLAQEERSHSATRGHLTRQRNRAKAGVCPVQGCKRHFRDLQRHMGSKHPDYKP